MHHYHIETAVNLEVPPQKLKDASAMILVQSRAAGYSAGQGEGGCAESWACQVQTDLGLDRG